MKKRASSQLIMVLSQQVPGCIHTHNNTYHMHGADKGRLHSHISFMGRKTPTVRQKTYDDIHGYYKARVEHLFAGLWSWGLCVTFSWVP